MSKHPHLSFRVQKRNVDAECTAVCIAGSGESFIIRTREEVEKIYEALVLDNKYYFRKMFKMNQNEEAVSKRL